VPWVTIALLLAAVLTGCDDASGPPSAGGVAGDAAPDAPGLHGPICGGHDIFVTTCAGGVCHHSGADRARGLDLLSGGPARRLVGVPATCAGRLLIDPVTRERSFLLEKLSSDTPECGGSRMPRSGDPLPPETIACVRAWILQVSR
jgi:hypothetical protein